MIEMACPTLKAENMSRRRIRIKKKRQNRFSMALVIMVILMLVVVVAFKRVELKNKQAEYDLREKQLTEQIESEKERATDIEEYGKYTKTKKYAEEVAKDKLGLVNDDEIIFQSEDD